MRDNALPILFWLCAQVYSGEPPFAGFIPDAINYNLRLGQRPSMLLNNPRAVNRGLSPELWQIVTISWSQEPGNRPSASRLSGWLKNSGLVYQQLPRGRKPSKTRHPEQIMIKREDTTRRLHKRSMKDLRLNAKAIVKQVSKHLHATRCDVTASSFNEQASTAALAFAPH